MKNKLFEGRDGMRKMMEIASGKRRVDELSPELLDRAHRSSMTKAGKAMGAHRDRLQSKGDYDQLKDDPDGPEGRYWKDKMEKFRKGYLAAKDREHDNEFDAGQDERMSPAAKRKMQQMHEEGSMHIDPRSSQWIERAIGTAMDEATDLLSEFVQADPLQDGNFLIKISQDPNMTGDSLADGDTPVTRADMQLLIDHINKTNPGADMQLLKFKQADQRRPNSDSMAMVAVGDVYALSDEHPDRLARNTEWD